MENIEAVAAIIVFEDKILCLRRASDERDYLSYKYEFLGGKIHPGEALPKAMTRVLGLEMYLNVKVRDKDFFKTIHYQYPDFETTRHYFFCRIDTQKIIRKDHISHQWLHNQELGELEWTAADQKIVDELARWKWQYK